MAKKSLVDVGFSFPVRQLSRLFGKILSAAAAMVALDLTFFAFFLWKEAFFDDPGMRVFTERTHEAPPLEGAILLFQGLK